MTNYCAFSQNHECIKWQDYMLTLHELKEADELCHGNWIEIERQYQRIKQLEATLRENGIPIPEEL